MLQKGRAVALSHWEGRQERAAEGPHAATHTSARIQRKTTAWRRLWPLKIPLCFLQPCPWKFRQRLPLASIPLSARQPRNVELRGCNINGLKFGLQRTSSLRFLWFWINWGKTFLVYQREPRKAETPRLASPSTQQRAVPAGNWEFG